MICEFLHVLYSEIHTTLKLKTGFVQDILEEIYSSVYSIFNFNIRAPGHRKY